MIPSVTMREALSDPALLGRILPGPSWETWRILLIAAWGEALSETERETFRRLTARDREPLRRIDELWAIAGRRGGKSRAMAALAAYVAGLCDHSDVLAPGERGICLAVAPDQRQARVVLDYVTAGFESTPMLAQLIASRTADALELKNKISIEVRSASFRRLRGPTFVAVLADEASFWLSDESANPDTEILNAVRPGLATTRGPLVCASSPYARKGEVWNTFRRNYGKDGDPLVLVAHGKSRTFNPTLSQAVVDRALERDRAAASAEYLAKFRTDLEAFLTLEAIESVTDFGVYERPYSDEHSYRCFIDPSGGSSDSMTAAITHAESDCAVLDCVREVFAPFSPAAAVKELSETIRNFGISSAIGDRYGAQWVVEEFQKNGISYQPADKSKSELFLELLPAVNAGRVSLLENKRLHVQLAGLERRTARGGRESVDHGPGAHDDLANAVAGALYLVGGRHSLWVWERLAG